MASDRPAARVDFPVPGSPPTMARRPRAWRRWVSARVCNRRASIGASVDPCVPAEAGDLRPDVGPRRAVEVHQRWREVLPGELLVVEEEPCTGLGTAQPLEVHRQEGHVGDDIAVAQYVGELDAVEDPDAVVETEDVIGLQVPVPVAHPAGGDAGLEETSTAVEPLTYEPSELRLDVPIEDRADEGLGFGEVGRPAGAQLLTGSSRRDVRRSRRPGVEGRPASGRSG